MSDSLRLIPQYHRLSAGKRFAKTSTATVSDAGKETEETEIDFDDNSGEL